MHKIFFSVILLLFLTSCGGGGGSDSVSNPATVVQGSLIDAEVEGVQFKTSTQSGMTNANGIFDYIAGEVVSFYIGDILLGSTTGAGTVTPIDFVASASDETNQQVTNILRFIQSLDSDSDLSNGIQISASSRTALIGQLLDFSLSENDFENSFNSLSGAVLGGLTLVSAADAQAHMRATLDALNGGGSTGGDFGSVMLSGADTSVFGTQFMPTSGSALNLDEGLGFVVWNSGNTDASNAGILYGLNVATMDGQLLSVRFGYQVGAQIHGYEIDCMDVVSPDCNKITFNKVNKQLTFSNNVTLSIQSLPGLDNQATGPIMINGTVNW